MATLTERAYRVAYVDTNKPEEYIRHTLSPCGEMFVLSFSLPCLAITLIYAPTVKAYIRLDRAIVAVVHISLWNLHSRQA